MDTGSSSPGVRLPAVVSWCRHSLVQSWEVISSLCAPFPRPSNKNITRGRCPWIAVRDVWVNIWEECLACTKHSVSLNHHFISFPVASSVTSIIGSIVPPTQYWTHLRLVLQFVFELTTAPILAEYFSFDWVVLCDKGYGTVTPVMELHHMTPSWPIQERRCCVLRGPHGFDIRPGASSWEGSPGHRQQENRKPQFSKCKGLNSWNNLNEWKTKDLELQIRRHFCRRLDGRLAWAWAENPTELCSPEL